MSKRARTTDDEDSEGHEDDQRIRPDVGDILDEDFIICTLPPRCVNSPRFFAAASAFETHYRREHSLICDECKCTLPSERFLDLHISEEHDPFVAARRERGEKVYACFMAECDKLCVDPKKRRMHLIDKHGYPKDFYFDVVCRGLLPNMNSLLRAPRRTHDGDGEEHGTAGTAVHSEVGALGERLQRVRLVPDKIHFGHRH
ncbi:uncharacterized protein V1518DRAFT_419181 [Limtongia smithiae]|uniref:uncharacterized protein n=1 Tax=Limtongia smithiae TaxID=1125753 RepID=UPI0034CD3DCE